MERLSGHSCCDIGYNTFEYSELFLESVACPNWDTEAHLLDGGTLRIMRLVSRDVLPEDSHIFHDCARPFERTIKLIGDTGGVLEPIRCTTGDWTHCGIASALHRGCHRI